MIYNFFVQIFGHTKIVLSKPKIQNKVVQEEYTHYLFDGCPNSKLRPDLKVSW